MSKERTQYNVHPDVAVRLQVSEAYIKQLSGGTGLAPCTTHVLTLSGTARRTTTKMKRQSAHGLRLWTVTHD